MAGHSRTSVFLLTLLLSAPLVAADLPDGPGREIVLTACGRCHRAEEMGAYRHTKGEWESVVARMVDRGAQVSRNETDTVVAYLSKNLGKVEDSTKVNVNEASAKELETGLKLTAKEAEAIVDYRERHGRFRAVGELFIIYGVDGAKIEAAKDRISF